MERINTEKNGVLRLLIAIVIIGATQIAENASAQVNIEALRQVKDTTGYAGSLALDLELDAGNMDVQEIELAGRFEYRHPLVNTLIIGRSDFGWDQGNRYTDMGLIHLRQQYAIHKRMDLEMFAQYDQNASYLLDTRLLAGGGLRITLMKTDRFLLWEGASLFIEHERLDAMPAKSLHPQRTTVGRLSNYLSSRFTVNERLFTSFTMYFQPRWNAWSDRRLLGECTMGIGLAGPLALSMNLLTRYDSQPPDSIGQFDVKLDTGLVVSF